MSYHQCRKEVFKLNFHFKKGRELNIKLGATTYTGFSTSWLKTKYTVFQIP